MKITKFGQSCMLIKEGEINILTDPGSYTIEATEDLTGIDLILIADEHMDHFHIPTIKALLENNLGLKIITQKSVQKLLVAEGIESDLLLDKQQTEFKGVKLEGCGVKHALLHSSIPQSDNTGYIIAEKFFYPGDALTVPDKQIEILALPVGGPWLKMSEVVDYVLELKPKFFFPIHDGMNPNSFMAKSIGQIVEKEGIKLVMPEGEMEF